MSCQSPPYFSGIRPLGLNRSSNSKITPNVSRRKCGALSAICVRIGPGSRSGVNNAAAADQCFGMGFHRGLLLSFFQIDRRSLQMTCSFTTKMSPGVWECSSSHFCLPATYWAHRNLLPTSHYLAAIIRRQLAMILALAGPMKRSLQYPFLPLLSYMMAPSSSAIRISGL